ncbi:MAG: hypothetical protein FJ096_03660 [Deltaproteobacteria bacterium]|nr:hypothetical protein [Deltaproteobacteria bacterium]
MPFKSLAGLKKIGSLDAEIVAFAPYQPASICAAFTNDPVRVGIYPFGAGQAKVQNLSLDRCSGGALLDERVAAAKSGDEIWALLDIQHKPRVDPAARSIRELVNNPGAPGALVLGWSGEGAELKVEGHDVAARDFTVRGSARACALDGASCFLVADDGEGGGRFREHPGHTPEAGTQLRCDLPLAAKKMNRLVGGAQLSALTKRGGEEICVVRKLGAGSLEAKIVVVDGGAVDVAVLETSLFVLSADGRLRLYAADVLHRTGDGGRALPTFELALGLDGAPTALAATSRGGNRLWIGSREGEVLRCDAVKGSMTL